MKLRPPTPWKLGKNRAGEHNAEPYLSAESHAETASTLEPKKSSPLQNASVASSPKKRRGGKKRKSSLRPAHKCLPLAEASPFARASVHPRRHMEAKEEEILQSATCDERANGMEASPLESRDTKDHDGPIDLTQQSIDVSAEVDEALNTPISENWSNVMSLPKEVTLAVPSTPFENGPQITISSSSGEVCSSEEAVISESTAKEAVSSDEAAEDTKDAVFVDLEKATKASSAKENSEKTLPPASLLLSSVLEPSPDFPYVDEARAAEKSVLDNPDQNIESRDKSDHKQLRNWNSPSSSHRLSSDPTCVENSSPPTTLLPPMPSPQLSPYVEEEYAFDQSPVWQEPSHEHQSDQPEASSGEGDRDEAAVLAGSAHGLQPNSGVSVKNTDDLEIDDIALVTSQSSREDETSASDELAARSFSSHANPGSVARNRPKIVVGPVRATQPGSRFSDETNMLREFLSRAQARKAARDRAHSAAPAPDPTTPRSPRKSLAEITNRSRSPKQPGHVAKRPGTPPGKVIVAMEESDDLAEMATEQPSCRRSARTRMFTPARPAPGAPSLIPVRRFDGSEKVILRRSYAQELATITRANTRRNRGQSKPPKLALRSLPVELLAGEVERRRGEGCGKSVGWDKRLVYYHSAAGTITSGAEVKGSRSRKVGAGAVTAGKEKSKCEPISPNEASGHKRRGRSKR